MRTLPAATANLIIADPPYKLNKEFGLEKEFDRLALEDWLSWTKTWITECARLLHPDGNLFIFGIHHYACFVQCHLYDLGMVYRRQIIWHYENGWSKYTNAPSCHYEPILWFSHSPTSTFHPMREPYKSTERLKHKIIKNGKTWTPHPDGRLAGDVWKVPTLAGRRFSKERTKHPTQKPLALSERIVKHFSNPGDMVWIPFVGSGTECVAAAKNDRRFFGAELNPTYVKIAEQRLQEMAKESSQ